MDGGQIELVGGIVGAALGLVGGAVGTYFSVKNTEGPRERQFMIRVSAFAWLIVTTFVAALFLLPQPYDWLLWVLYGIGLTVAIRQLNRRQLEIRAEERAGPHMNAGT